MYKTPNKSILLRKYRKILSPNNYNIPDEYDCPDNSIEMLIDAIKLDDIKNVKEMLDSECVYVNQIDSTGMYPLSYSKSPEMATLLIEYGSLIQPVLYYDKFNDNLPENVKIVLKKFLEIEKKTKNTRFQKHKKKIAALRRINQKLLSEYELINKTLIDSLYANDIEQINELIKKGASFDNDYIYSICFSFKKEIIELCLNQFKYFCNDNLVSGYIDYMKQLKKFDPLKLFENGIFNYNLINYKPIISAKWQEKLNGYSNTFFPKMNISGPITASFHFSTFYDMEIVIFGDIHDYKNPCNEESKYISTFIKDIILSNPTKLIDIMLEERLYSWDIGIENYEIKPDQGYLFEDVNRVMFKECLKIDKSKCQFKNSRFHYCDARSALPEDLFLVYDFIELIKNKLTYETSEDKTKTNVFRIDKFKISIQNAIKRLENMSKFTRDDILDLIKVNKQIDKIPFKEIINILIDRIEDPLRYSEYKGTVVSPKSMIRFFNDLLKFLNSIKTPIISYIPDKLYFYSRIVSDYWLMFMDVYLFARMFAQPMNAPRPKNIIIYTGDAHSDVYRKMLNTLKFSSLGNTSLKSEERRYLPDLPRCLDLSTFPKNMFSN